ncbi:hypothetical protein EW145_g2431 [Phellinidium pouzarii]|uniref:Uncharacterized protein n=1 Tax=Phellinidium pouzarii TaxID=167371 RepID=A0A4S4LBD0_9AGAM|nr:hypothetical protein EW145_g2431 [Phellinidium pouzarii]
MFSCLYDYVGETYNFMTDRKVSYGDHYSILRHSKPFVVYQGTKTQVPITIFGDARLPEDRKVFLQRRGYRTGIFGWTLGGMLGGSKLPGIDVTPAEELESSSLPARRLSQLNADISRLFFSQQYSQKPLQTLIVHIPVSAGDGYFRLRVTAGDEHKTIAVSPSFRIGSLSWSSAHPQGATPAGLVPELLVRSVFVAAKTTAYASFYATFPFLKLAEWTPGPWRQYAMQALYTHALTKDQQAQVSDNISKGKVGYQRAHESIYRKVPFGAVGVRSTADLEKDELLGRAGSWFSRET